MINKELYAVLTTFGGGKWINLGDSVRILSVKDKKFDLEKYKKNVRKCLEYGWISCKKSGLPVFAYGNMFGITQRGSDALEFFKGMRYHHTDRRILLSAEGRAMITLPGQNKQFTGKARY